MNHCLNCGTEYAGENPLAASHCGKCPPWPCDGCGEMCSAAALCGCWTDFTGMNLADIKAAFATDCDCGEPELSVDPVIEP